MRDLRISRRTLQRWLDDLDIESLEFEDHLRVFLKLPDVIQLRNYGRVMQTRSQVWITRYRDAHETGNERRMAKILREIESKESVSKEDISNTSRDVENDSKFTEAEFTQSRPNTPESCISEPRQ